MGFAATGGEKNKIKSLGNPISWLKPKLSIQCGLYKTWNELSTHILHI